MEEVTVGAWGSGGPEAGSLFTTRTPRGPWSYTHPHLSQSMRNSRYGDGTRIVFGENLINLVRNSMRRKQDESFIRISLLII